MFTPLINKRARKASMIRIVSVFIALLISLVALAANMVSSFSATLTGSDVRLEWRLEQEDQVQGFEVYRKKPDEATFTKVAVLNASGLNNYSWVDDGLYKSLPAQQGSNNAVNYRLVVKTTTGSLSYFASLNQAPTAVQRSWGSIKAMFK